MTTVTYPRGPAPVLELKLTGPQFHPGIPRGVKLDGHEIPGVRSIEIKSVPGDIAVAFIEVMVGDVIVTREDEPADPNQRRAERSQV